MRVTPLSYGIIDISADNDAERVWLSMLLCDIDKRHLPFLSHYFTVDLESSCRKKDMTPAKNMAIEDVIDKKGDRTWGLVDKIRFCATGNYADDEVERRIKLLK
jgi:hypothetical protein